MTKTPAQIDLRLHRTTHRYYDGNRFADDAAVDAAWDRGQALWFTALIGPADIPDEAEEDCMARDRDEASAVMRAAVARDFVDGVRATNVRLA